MHALYKNSYHNLYMPIGSSAMTGPQVHRTRLGGLVYKTYSPVERSYEWIV